MKSITNIDITNKQLVLRADLNVPLKQRKIQDDSRIQAILPTLHYIKQHHASAIILSHLGRPNEGGVDSTLSLAPIAKALSNLLGQEVTLLNHFDRRPILATGQIILAENVRFLEGEKDNDLSLAQKLAGLGDIVVMDAFATAHRKQASTYGLVEQAKEACAGLLLNRELDTLYKAFDSPKHPVLAIVGGSKLSTKIKLLEKLLPKIDFLIPGGGIANTFLAALGKPVGISLVESSALDETKALIELAESLDVQILLPSDVIVAKSINQPNTARTTMVSNITEEEGIFDVGPATSEQYNKIAHKAKTILWNGPVGVFEISEFSKGTKSLCNAIATSTGFSIAGGGDTLSAIHQFGLANKISYLSTGGGAFLSFLQGDPLPVIDALNKKK